MTDREIVSAADEQATERERERTAQLQTFMAQWDLESIPACPVGMGLLMEFAEAHPSAYRLALARGFVAAPEHPMFASLAKWKAFAEHVSTCRNCNER